METQPIQTGSGPEFHRKFTIAIDLPEMFVQRAMTLLKSDLNLCLPQLIASATKIKGEPGVLTVGDELELRYFLTARAPLKVSHVDHHGFVLKTLKGHLEAGEARVSLKQDAPDRFRLECETLARSRDGLVDFIYDKLPVARIVQAVLWVEFCENFLGLAAELAGLPRPPGEVRQLTERRYAGEAWEVLDQD